MGNHKPRKALPLTLYTAPGSTGVLHFPGPAPAHKRKALVYQRRKYSKAKVTNRTYVPSVAPSPTVEQQRHQQLFQQCQAFWSSGTDMPVIANWMEYAYEADLKKTGNALFLSDAFNRFSTGGGPAAQCPGNFINPPDVCPTPTILSGFGLSGAAQLDLAFASLPYGAGLVIGADPFSSGFFVPVWYVTFVFQMSPSSFVFPLIPGSYRLNCHFVEAQYGMPWASAELSSTIIVT